MKKLAPLVLVPAAGIMSATAAVTDNLVAYWNFEGATTNHASASGGAPYNGTLMGNASTAGTAKVGSGALLVDGNGDYMDVTSVVDVTQPWSVSAWFRSAIAPAGAVRGFVFESSGGYAMSFGIREGTPATNTSFQLYTDNTPTADANAAFQVADTSTTDTWHHIIAVFTPATSSTAGSIIGYLDGIQQYNLVIPVGDTMTASNGFHVGTYRSANDRWFTGSIDEVAMWNRTLAPAEALEVYSRGNQGDTLVTTKINIALTATPAGQGTVSGTGVYNPGEPVSVSAAALPGYVFLSWDGDFTGRPATFTYTANAAVTATASFGQDTSDTDGDGLSNYDEIVVHLTMPNNPDTDGDLIPDGAEVGTTGTNPLTSDIALVNFVRSNLSPNQAGAIALSPLRITRTPGSGAISLALSLSGSTDRTNWQDISLSSPSASIVPAGDGWSVTIPAPSSTVNSYILRSSRR